MRLTNFIPSILVSWFEARYLRYNESSLRVPILSLAAPIYYLACEFTNGNYRRNLIFLLAYMSRFFSDICDFWRTCFSFKFIVRVRSIVLTLLFLLVGFRSLFRSLLVGFRSNLIRVRPIDLALLLWLVGFRSLVVGFWYNICFKYFDPT